MKKNDVPANNDSSEKEKKNRDFRKLADKIGPVSKNRFPKEQSKNSKKESFFSKTDKDSNTYK